MKLHPLGINQTELITDTVSLLFSYSNPVAARMDGMEFRTAKMWSTTTDRHVAKWLKYPVGVVQVRPQSFFDELLSSLGKAG